MKKKLSYRDKLLELAYIYNVKEIQEYVKRRKNLTSGQIELILKKNKIIIPKEFKTNFFKENFTKPISKFKSNIKDFKEEKIRDKNRFFRRIENYKYDTSRKVNHGISSLWKNLGIAGINVLNIFPKLGNTVTSFFGNLFTDVFNSIYNQQIDKRSARNVILGFFIVVGITTAVIAGLSTYKNFDFSKNKVFTKKEDTKVKKEVKKNEPKIKKETALQNKKEEKKTTQPVKKDKKVASKPLLKPNKEKKVTESILPDLNLKTETVLNLFEDVNYDLNKVRRDKKVKPIYFTQFPRDLDELQSVKLKK